MSQIPVLAGGRVCGGTPVQLGTRTFCGGAVDGNGVEYHATDLEGWRSQQVRTDAIERPFQHGDYDDSGWYGPRFVVLSGRLEAPAAGALLAARDDLDELLDALATDQLLISGDRQAKVRLAGQVLTKRINPCLLRFQATLKASDPRLYGTTARSLTLSPGQSGDAVNMGRFRDGAPLQLTFTGPLTNPVLTIDTQTFGLSGPLGAGVTVLVDTRESTVLYVSGISAYGQVTPGSVFPLLPPRATTTVSLAGTGSGTVRVDWRDTWR